MKADISWRTLALAAVSIAPLLGGCVTNAGYRQAIADREAEIRELREERTALKGQLRSMRSQLETSEQLGVGADVEASMRDVQAQIAAASEPRAFAELDDLGIDYGMRNGQMVISIPSEITFRSGRADLSDGGRKALLQVARTLEREYPAGGYYIAGHTDSDPIKKSRFASNRELSLARAMAVLTYLVEECGVSDASCAVVGHGEYQPLAANDTDANKARNRRVEIVVDASGV